MILYQRYCRDCDRAFEAYEADARICDECEAKMAEAPAQPSDRTTCEDCGCEEFCIDYRPPELEQQ